MEALDPPKNIAKVGTSRRRISSILKAPRTSVPSLDPENVETPVQVAMPVVEKRNSRRVSFAPAADVLLFSKEKRSGSPVRSPLQDLSATNIPDNRNPIGVIEKVIQPITDMETLLYAPLQTSQQRKEAVTVSHDAEDLCGERTMIFSADDAAMDLTHSHTMVIADDSDVFDQHGERLSTCANMDFFFTMDRGKAEPCSLPKTTSSSVHGFDPEFEKLLASISKPTAPRDHSVLPKVEQYAAMMPHDKENQAPTFMTTKRESLPHKTVKLGESSNRGVELSEDTQGMEMTDVITGHIVENVTADDPLQCLFPTLDLYRHSEHKEAAKRDGRQRCFEPLKCSSSNSNDKPTTKTTVADSKKFGLGIPSLKMGSSLNLNFPQACPLPENRLISQNKIVQHVLHSEQYANCNSSESDDMDMTRSQTVAIDSRSLHAVTTLAKPQEKSRFSFSAPYKASADFEHDMDFTRSQTGVIEAKNLDLGKSPFTINAGGSVREMADNQQDRAVNQEKITMYNLEFDNMEITQSQTAVIESLHGVKPLPMSQDIVTSSAKWNNPSVDDDMEFTTCHTSVFETKDVPIGHVGILGLNQTLGLEEDTKINRKPSQTVVSKYHDTESDDMEITRSQTVAIDAKSLNVAIGTLQDKKHASMAFMSAFTKAFTQNASQNEFGREISKMHSNTLLLPEDAMNGRTCQPEGFEHYNCESDDMEMTKSQTVAIDAKLNEVNPSDYKRRKSLALTIDHKSQSSGFSIPGKHLGSFFSKTEPAVDADMDLTRSQTGLIEVKPLDLGNPSYKLGSGRSMSVLDSKATFKDDSEAMRMGANQMKTFAQYNCESDDMEMTKSQTIAIDTKNLNEGNPSDYKRRKSLALTIDHKSQSSGLSVPGKNLGSFFSNPEPAVDADMDLTRSQTGLIEVKPLDLGNPSYKLGSGGSMSVLDSKATFKDDSEAMRMGANQMKTFAQYNFESDDMEMTKSQTIAIDTKNLNEVNPSDYKRRKSLALTIDHKSQSSGLSVPGKNLGSFFSNPEPAVDADMDLTRSQTGLIEVKPLDLGNPSYKLGSGGSMSVLDSTVTFKDDSKAMRMGANQMKTFAQYNCESDDMEMTKSQTVAIDTKNLNEVNPSDYKRRKSLALTIDHKSQSSGFSIPGKHLGSFFSKTEPAVDADMDLTRSQTGLIEVKPLDLGNPSYNLGSGRSMSVLDSKATFKDDSGAMRMGANQMKTFAQYNCESDDMEMTKSQTIAIDTKNLNEGNPSDYKRRKSLALTIDHKSQSSGLSVPGKNLGSFFSKPEPAVDADMDLTRSQTGLIEVKPLDLGNPSYPCGGSTSVVDSKTTFKDNSEAMRMGANQMKTLAQYNCESDDMEMTKSQTVAIETKNLNSVHPLESNKRKSLAFLNTIDHISKPSDLSMPGMFSGSCFSNLESGVATDMSLTRSQTRPIEVKPQLLLNDTRAMEREGSGQYNYESDDMELTKSQTVAIDAKNLIAANPLESKRRKSLAFVSTCTKGDNVREDGHCEDKIQTNPEADSEMEFTRSQTGLIETKHLHFVKPSLKINSGKVFPTLVSNTHLPISMNAIENTKSSHNVTNIFPEANQENDKHTLCSEDMELRRSQTVALNCKRAGISNVLFHRARKSLPLLKEKSSGLDFNEFSSELRNPDELDITRSHTVAIESKDTHSPEDASLNNSQLTGPPEDSSQYNSGSAGELGGDLKSRSPGLTDLGAIQLNQEATTLPEASSESTAVQSKHGSELRHENSSLPLESASCINAALDSVDKTSTKTKRMSLGDLQSKLRRMSRLPNEPTEKLAVDYCDAPSSQPKSSLDRIRDKTQLLTSPPHNPETRMTNNANSTPPAQSAEEDQPCLTAPLTLNRKSLSSRLSLGNFLPKLPQKIKAADLSSRSSAEGLDNQVITHQLSSSGMTLDDDLVNEVLPNISSDEDLSMVTENPQANEDEGGPLHERDAQEAWEEEARELPPGHPSDTQGKRPSSPVDGEDTMATEKRRRISLNSTTEMPSPSPEKGMCTSPLPLAPAVMTQAIDVSNSSNTAPLRSETTFESTLRQSLFESHLEDIKDYTNDFQKNVDDERMTVSEFFKLLNIDFVIHNPRQSIVPGKLASDLDRTPEDLLKNRHINRPKQKVYESDHQNLAEKVERLKARMKDQGRLLHSVNKPLWEELKSFSEDELKQFGSKMKERSYFFRKRSKAQSHEMKEALYSHLLQANLEEQQKLREKTEEADGMLRSLDDCIQELETELAAIEGHGLDDSKPTLKSSQLGLENVTMELADKERQMCEMEMQKKCNMDEVKRLQMEIQDLNGHITMLHRVNEWKVAERRADCDVYSFLYESLHLEVAFDSRAGKGPEEDNERNVLDINFKLALDEEKSECHARLVHTLLSEFIEGRSDWVEKYPSSRCIPKLLHDVGLVVSRCRLLGEEVRRLRAWGSLRLDVLDVRCVDTRVHIVFSSLEAMAKFELSLAVTGAYPCCPLRLQDFKNHIGSTTAQRIEDVVSSVSPGKNYLTKVVKAIHAAVLS